MTRIRAAFIALIIASVAPGSFTATLPAAPATSLVVGYVLKAHATAGLLFVRVWLNGSIEPAVFHNTSYFSKPVTFASGSTQADHNREIGHTISTQPTAGGLVRAVLHFN